MNGINQYVILGRVGKDPTYRELQFGGLLHFSVATTEKIKAGRDGWKDETVWHQVKVWGKTADHFNGKIRKGSLVMVSGKAFNDEYEKDGQKKSFWHLKASEVRLFDGAGSGSGRGGNGGGQSGWGGDDQRYHGNGQSGQSGQGGGGPRGGGGPPPHRDEDIREDLPF